MKWDTNGNGLLDRDEFVEGMKTYGFEPKSKAMDFLLKVADRNGDGNIDYIEFRDAFLHPAKVNLARMRKKETAYVFPFFSLHCVFVSLSSLPLALTIDVRFNHIRCLANMGVMPDSTITAPKENVREHLWISKDGRRTSHADIEWGGHEEDGSAVKRVLEERKGREKKRKQREEWR